MEDFLNWELTNRMHNLGYDGKTLMYIDDEEDIINDDSAELIGAKPAILTSAAFRWFRDEYGLSCYIKEKYENKKFFYSISEKGIVINGTQVHDILTTYEEAELACLDKLIEIVEFKSTENNPNTRTMEKLIESNRKFDEKNNGDVKYNPSDRNEGTPNITNFFI